LATDGDLLGRAVTALERLSAGTCTAGEGAAIAAEVIKNPPAVIRAAQRYLGAIGQAHEGWRRLNCCGWCWRRRGSGARVRRRQPLRRDGRVAAVESLDEAVARLVSKGLRAQQRRWILGDTVLATPAHGEVVAGWIEVFAQALYVVCTDGVWEVVNCMSQQYESTPRSSLAEACDLVIQRLVPSDEPGRG
jgi:hypothetical protein